MRRLFIVHGMKRSGNTAIINWIRAHDRFIYFNNVIPIQPVLRNKARIPPPEDFKLWIHRRILPRPLQFSARFLDWVIRRHSIIVNLEDHDLGIRLFRNVPCDVINILIIRDPCNLFSSRIRRASIINDPEVYPKDTGPFMQRVLQLWKTHAHEYLGLTQYLDNMVGIYLDSWFSDRDYRRQLSRELDLEFTDRAFSRVSRKGGGGSSFDGTRFDGNNLRMDVLNRRDYLSDAELYLLDELLKDEEVCELARDLENRSKPLI